MKSSARNELSRRTLLKGIASSSVAFITDRANKPPTEDVERSFIGAEPETAFAIYPRSTVVIAVPRSGDELIRMGAERLASHIQRVTGVAPQIILHDPQNVTRTGIVIELTERPILYFRSDGYEIIAEQKGQTSSVNILAPSAAGLKYGVYRLIREMHQRGHELHVPRVQLSVNPWIKTREIFIADLDWRDPTPTERKSLPELQRKFDWPNWEISRLETYVDVMDAMGYNSIMLTDPRALSAFSNGFASSIEDVIEKVQAMFRRARRNGMRTAFFLWGQQGAGPIAHDYLVSDNNPQIPEQMAKIKAHWEAVVETYGSLVDRWVLHWADPGGCKAKGCTIETPQLLTNRFSELVRQHGLQADVSFSLWALRWGADASSRPWPGYGDWTSVVDSGVLSPEVGICMMRHFSYSQARAIVERNRKAGVWGWYLNDIETNSGMHAHQQVLQREFSRADQNASTLLDWYSLEDNNHCLNPPSVYVGAQMLWNRETSAMRSIREFCTSVWGPAAGIKIAKALDAIGQVRCGPGQHMLDQDLWPDDFLCWFGKGSCSPGDDVEICEKALAELDSAKMDPDYIPQLPMVLDSNELLGYIRAHLAYVLAFARIRLAYKQALEPAREGRLEEAQRKMLVLPELPDFIPGVYGAGQETTYYKLLRTFANTWRGRSFADNLALHKNATASSWSNEDPRFAPTNAVNGILCEFEEEGWAAGDPGPAWLKIDLGAVETVRCVRIYNRGYRRETWDNNLVATPSKVKAFCAIEDADLSRGSLDGHELGYQLLGGFEEWEGTDDPGAYREIVAEKPTPARFLKIIIYSAAHNQRVGCGEVEVRGT